jgi:hypothetical protein
VASAVTAEGHEDTGIGQVGDGRRGGKLATGQCGAAGRQPGVAPPAGSNMAALQARALALVGLAAADAAGQTLPDAAH